MSKLNKKKLLLGIAVIFVLFAVVFYIFTNFVYLPGVHIWWRFCSVNIEKNCYWYDEEAQEFTGESSPIKIKVTGFDWPEWLSFMHGNSNLKGIVELADYPIWSEGHDAHLIFSYDLSGYYSDIYVLEYYSIVDNLHEIIPRNGDIYSLVIPHYSTVPEHIMVYLFEEREENSGPKKQDKTGYVADSLEEAKAMQEFGIKKKP